MADFSFLLGGGYKPPDIDIYAPYKQALTLRQLADAREYQRAQRRHMQLQEQDALEKRQRAEQLRGLFRGGTAPTREQILATDPIGGMALLKEMDALEKEERLKASATTEAQAKKTEQQKKINEAVANIGMEAMKIPLVENLPEKAQQPREAWFQQQMAGTLIDAGITPAEQFGAFPVPQNEQRAQMYYASVHGPDKLQAYLKGEREKTSAALKTSGDQLDLFGRLLGGVRTPADWSAVVQSAPPEIRSLLNPMFSPDELKRAQNMVLTAQQRAQEEGQAATRKATLEQHQATQEGSLLDDYTKQAADYIKIRDAWGKIQGAAQSQTGAGDMSLIFAYMKMLDPGSTVREGEYATAQQAGSIPQNIVTAYNRAIKGEKLHPDVRRDFVAESQKIYGQAYDNYQKLGAIFTGIAKNRGLNPANIVIDLTPAVPESGRNIPAAGGQAAPGGGMPATLGGIPNPLLNNEPPVRVRRDANGRLVK